MGQDPWARVTQLALRQHGVFTRSQAAELGVDSRRIRTALADGRITALSQKVLGLPGRTTSVHSMARAATFLSACAIASHRTAATLFGFEVTGQGDVDISIPVDQRQRIPATMNVRVHHTSTLEQRDLVTVAGIPCTSKARTLADLGSVVDSDEVLRALISAHRTGMSLRLLRSTALRLHRPGQQGTKVLLEHLDSFDRAGAAPESWFEEVLRRIIDHPELPPLVSQYELHDRGRFIARFDHAFPDARVAVEAHSKQFHFGPVRESVDEDRDLRAQRAGWVVVYLGWHVTRRPDEVVELLREVVTQRLPMRPAG